MAQRGTFIVLEGLDKAGKSTQAARLVANLCRAGIKARGIRFPDRSTPIGKMIDSYLKQDSEMDDHAVHLLFSANRWEAAASIRRDLADGTTLVCDRYAFSGIAFTAAKGLDFEWSRSCDIGLPAPDLTVFLSLSPEMAAHRGLGAGYGQERYESETIQSRVRGIFGRLGDEMGATRWQMLDAGKSLEEVEKDLFAVVSKICLSTPERIEGLWEKAGSS